MKEAATLFKTLPIRRRLGLIPVLLVLIASSVSRGLLLLCVGPLVLIISNLSTERPTEALSDGIKLLGSNIAPVWACILFISLAIACALLGILSSYVIGSYTAKISIDLMQNTLRVMLHEPFILNSAGNSSKKISNIQEAKVGLILMSNSCIFGMV